MIPLEETVVEISSGTVNSNSCLKKKVVFFFLAASGLFCSMRASLVAADRLRCTMACGILVPQPGVEPVSPALEGEL